jgi:hypothetical protein
VHRVTKRVTPVTFLLVVGLLLHESNGLPVAN